MVAKTQPLKQMSTLSDQREKLAKEEAAKKVAAKKTTKTTTKK